MSKKGCSCGTENVKEKPLIITITTCKQNCHSSVKKKPSNPLSTPVASSSLTDVKTDKPHSAKSSATNDSAEDEEAIHHLLYCEDEEVEIQRLQSPKGQGEPIESGTGCDLDQLESEEVRIILSKVNRSTSYGKEQMYKSPCCDEEPPKRSREHISRSRERLNRRSCEKRQMYESPCCDEEPPKRSREHISRSRERLNRTAAERRNRSRDREYRSKSDLCCPPGEECNKSDVSISKSKTPSKSNSICKKDKPAKADKSVCCISRLCSKSKIRKENKAKKAMRDRSQQCCPEQHHNEDNLFDPYENSHRKKRNKETTFSDQYLYPEREDSTEKEESFKSVTYARKRLSKQQTSSKEKRSHDTIQRPPEIDEPCCSSKACKNNLANNEIVSTSEAPKEIRKQVTTKNECQSSNTVSCSQRKSGHKLHDYGSAVAVMLPILTPRYHGTGCAMEVSILEKHDIYCRYKKVPNPNRNYLDDRSGSYEVIGRVKFKTCQPETSSRGESSRSNAISILHQDPKVSQIYSIFGIHKDITTFSKLHPSSSKSEDKIEALEKYLRYHKVLESLVKSSKSFPNTMPSKYRSLYDQIGDIRNEKGCGTQCCCKDFWSYEVQELFVARGKTDKSIQISGKYRSRSKFSRWLHVFFSCLNSDDSLEDDSIIYSAPEIDYEEKYIT